MRPGRGLLLGTFAAAFAFLLACPGAVLDSAKFGQDFAQEAYHVQHLPELEFAHTGSGFVYQIARNLDAGMSLPLLLLSLISIGYALGRRERGDGLLAAFALPFYVLISLAAVRYARYTIPLLPVLALWVGRLLADGSRFPHPPTRRIAIAVSAGALLFTFADSLLLIQPMTRQDNRDVALGRIAQIRPTPEAVIGFAVQPWFYTPPVSPWFCLPVPGAWRQATTQETWNRIVYTTDWDVQALQVVRPSLVVLSEYDYDDALRLHAPAALTYLRALQRDYRRQSVIGEGYSIKNGLPEHSLPSDMLYTNPVISIYTRK